MEANGLRYERAASMALLSKRFGIAPESRMNFVTTKNGIQVWDLDMEIEYTIGRLNAEPEPASRPVPEKVKMLFELSNDELKMRLFGPRAQRLERRTDQHCV